MAIWTYKAFPGGGWASNTCSFRFEEEAPCEQEVIAERATVAVDAFQLHTVKGR